jgi:carbon catabolite-derepressing protein kinase
MNLQLYMIDSINYLVDFTHKASYRASAEPGAGKFDATVPQEPGRRCVNESEVVSPYAFMDVACRLILELAGSAE